MGDFEIACGKVTRWAEKINDCSKDVKRQEGLLADIAGQIRIHDEDSRILQQALFRITDSLHRQQVQMHQYGDTLENIVRAYEHTETAILTEGAANKPL